MPQPVSLRQLVAAAASLQLLLHTSWYAVFHALDQGPGLLLGSSALLLAMGWWSWSRLVQRALEGGLQATHPGPIGVHAALALGLFAVGVVCPVVIGLGVLTRVA